MTNFINKNQIGRLLLFLTFFALSGGFKAWAGVCTYSEFETQLSSEVEHESSQFNATLSSLVKIDPRTPNAQIENEISKISGAEEIENIGSKFHTPIYGTMDGFGVILGSASLMAGIRDGNQGEVVIGSTTIISSIVFPLIIRLVASVAGEAAAEITGGVLGVGLAIGFNIYSGVEDDKMIAKTLAQDNALSAAYKAVVVKILGKMAIIKKIVRGDNSAAYQYDLSNIGKFLIDLNKKKVDMILDKIVRAGLSKKAPTLYDKYLNSSRYNQAHELKGILHTANADVNEIRDTLQKYSSYNVTHNTVKYLLLQKICLQCNPVSKYQRMHTNQPADTVDVREYPTYNASLNHRYWKDYFPELVKINPAINADIVNAPHYSQGFDVDMQKYYTFLLVWYAKVYQKVVLKLVDSTIEDDHDQIMGLMQMLKMESSNIQFQQQMRVAYNKVLDEKVGWLLMGEKIIDLVEHNGDKAKNDVLWFLRVASPILEPFIDGSVVKQELKDYGVAPVIARLVSAKIASNASIFDDWNVHSVNLQDKPIAGYILKAIDWAQDQIDTMKLEKSDIKPLSFNLSANSPTMKDIESQSKSGVLDPNIGAAIKQYVSSQLPADRGNATVVLGNIMLSQSILAGSYFDTINIVVADTIKKLDKTTGNDGIYRIIDQARAEILRIRKSFYELNIEPGALELSYSDLSTNIPHKYGLNFEKHIKKLLKKKAGMGPVKMRKGIKWFGIEAVPYAKIETDLLLGYLDKIRTLYLSKTANLPVSNLSGWFPSKLFKNQNLTEVNFCRGVFRGGLHIGTLEKGDTCLIPWDGRVHKIDDYEVFFMSESKHEWVSVVNSVWEHKQDIYTPIAGYMWKYNKKTRKGIDPLYMCKVERKTKNGTSVSRYGKVDKGFCHYPYQEGDYIQSSYELLTTKKLLTGWFPLTYYDQHKYPDIELCRAAINDGLLVGMMFDKKEKTCILSWHGVSIQVDNFEVFRESDYDYNWLNVTTAQLATITPVETALGGLVGKIKLLIVGYNSAYNKKTKQGAEPLYACRFQKKSNAWKYGKVHLNKCYYTDDLHWQESVNNFQALVRSPSIPKRPLTKKL